MIIETRSAEETFEVGRKIGEEANAGQVFTLIGDLGVENSYLHRDLQKDLE